MEENTNNQPEEVVQPEPVATPEGNPPTVPTDPEELEAPLDGVEEIPSSVE